MTDILDNILLSENVVDEFYKHYQDKQFKDWLLSIVPEIEQCKNQQQDNPWHIYNVLDHILHSVEEINKQTQNNDFKMRRMLAYTMFFHDIAKPKCHIKRFSKLYGRVVDSFFDHNIESEKIAKRVLLKLNFDEEQTEIICALVYNHDIFMYLTLKDDGNKYHKVLTPALICEILNDFDKIGNGKQLAKMLVKVGRADNLAQNPKMTKQSLELLDVFEDMLEKI